MVSEQNGAAGGQICPNCSEQLSGSYCSGCGQRQLDLDQPFREIAGEAMESFLSFDARILRTLWPLIRSPGFLTTEFLVGRRVRYVHPFKLYFACSVLLFLVLSLSGWTVVHVDTGDDSVVGLRIETAAEDEARGGNVVTSGESSFLARVLGPVAELAQNDPDRLNRIFTDRLAKSIILLVPVFALLLFALYRRRRYVAHLVFSLHIHSFAYLAIIVGMVIDLTVRSLQGSGPGNGLAVLAMAVYSFLSLRRVYQQGRFLTVAKMVFLLAGYLAALMVTMMVTFALTVVSI